MTSCRTNKVGVFACAALLVACLVGFVQAPCAYAINTGDLDLDATGSISITMRENASGQLVAGGEVSVIRVGQIERDNADLSFVPTDELQASGLDLSDVGSADLAQQYAAYVLANDLSLVTREVQSDATVSFDGLPLGVYLVMQNTPASGYNAFLPFLVTVPSQENDAWLYDVDATPKVELYSAPIPKTPEDPTPPPGDRLPQTGQLNWPVWVLGAVGAVLLLVGFLCLRRPRTAASPARRR